MRVDPRPTRAEVSDAANSVDEGADAIMLAGETAAGAFPVKAVQTLDAVIRDAESLPPVLSLAGFGSGPAAADTHGSRHGLALAQAAVTLATTGQADAIVAVTTEGRTARLLSACRPAAPILAAIPDGQIAGALSLLWGVAPVVTAERNIDRLTRSSSTAAFCQPARSSCSSTSVPEQDRTDANFLHVRRISAPDAP